MLPHRTMKSMNWKSLLSDSRMGRQPKSRKDKEDPAKYRPPWQADFDRITFGSAFRRLQDKTQVFPLSSSDYVRTRLTHSMEAASVARSLGNWVGYELKEKPDFPVHVHPLEIGMIVAAATLAHDIGNPPFGHSGEDAIRSWFVNSPTVQAVNKRRAFTSRQKADFVNFEGNAQGFRILVKLQMYKERDGMRLTDATLGAFSKYPAEVWDGKKPGDKPVERKKFGFFQADAEQFAGIADRLGLIPRKSERRCWARHPLAYLVEAADDICYRLVDFEDAFQQKLINFECVKMHLIDAAGVAADGEFLRELETEDYREQINHLRATAIGRAIKLCTAAFMERGNYQRIMNGTFDESLVSVTDCAQVFAKIKSLQETHVYANDRVLRVEAAGFPVLSGLLESFFKAACDVAATGKAAKAESKKMYNLLPEQYRSMPEDAPYIRLLRVTDYICGMTDRYAVDLYRHISGISLP